MASDNDAEHAVGWMHMINMEHLVIKKHFKRSPNDVYQPIPATV
jgi:hypothetical protein